MALQHNKVKKHPTTFHRLFGVTPQEFEIILEKVEPLWQKKGIGGDQKAWSQL